MPLGQICSFPLAVNETHVENRAVLSIQEIQLLTRALKIYSCLVLNQALGPPGPAFVVVHPGSSSPESQGRIVLLETFELEVPGAGIECATFCRPANICSPMERAMAISLKIRSLQKGS